MRRVNGGDERQYGIAEVPTGRARWLEPEERGLGFVVVHELGDLQTRMERQFLHHVMYVAFNSVSCDVEVLSDFLIALAIGNQDDDFTFALRHADSMGWVPLLFPQGEINDVSKE